MSGVKTVAVEDWLKCLPLANGSKAKVRNVMHALFNHAMRHANSRITLDVYTQGLMPTKRRAQGRVVKSLLAPNGPTPATSVAASA